MFQVPSKDVGESICYVLYAQWMIHELKKYNVVLVKNPFECAHDGGGVVGEGGKGGREGVRGRERGS